MRLFKLVTILFVCFCSGLHAQSGLFWNQYAAGNPAATGVNSDLDISSVASYYGNSAFRERISADVGIKKLHGAIGIGYRYTGTEYYQGNNPYLNYSFHWKIGENSLLAFGASADFANFKYGDRIIGGFNENRSRFGFGTHYQYKGLKVGVALSAYQNSYSGINVEISDAYVDYTLKLGENWAINAAAHAGNSVNYGSSVMARAIYKNKFWFGASYDRYDDFGLMVGINLNDKWSIGYAISANYSDYRGLRVVNQNLMVRFQMGK